MDTILLFVRSCFSRKTNDVCDCTHYVSTMFIELELLDDKNDELLNIPARSNAWYEMDKEKLAVAARMIARWHEEDCLS